MPSCAAGPPSPSRWNGWNTASRWSRGMPAPRSMTRMSTWSATGAGLDADRRALGRPVEGVLDHVRERPLEQRRRRRVTSGRSSGTSDVDADVSTARLAERGVDDLVDGRRARSATPSMPGLQPAHVEQVGDERVRRSASASMVSANVVDVLGRPARRRWLSRLVAAALMLASGPAQVVGHRGEEGVAQVVGLGEGGGPGRLGLEPRASSGRAAAGRRTRRGGGGPRPGSGGTGDDEHRAAGQLGGVRARRRASPAPGRRRRPRPASRPSSGARTATASRPRWPQLGHEPLQRLGVEDGGALGEPGQRLGLGLAARELRGAPRQAVDEPADEHGDGDEHDEGDERRRPGAKRRLSVGSM